MTSADRFRPNLYADGACVYELDRNRDIVRIVAWSANQLVAVAAFEELVRMNPDQSFSCRHRSRVLGEHFPDVRTT